MRRYVKGDKVEVLSEALEHSWYLARIVEGYGDVYTVRYDGHSNGMVFEVVLAKYIRPCPPVVEFTNWSRGDLVHVFDNFAWKLAIVLQVLEKKQFMVRVVGSMLGLIVGAASIRVRHCWQHGRWIVVGKGPSISDVRQPGIRRNNNLDSRAIQMKKSVRATRGTTARQKSHNLPTRLVKKNAPGTLDQTEVWRKEVKISRAIGRHSLCTPNHTDTCTGTGMRSRLTEEPQGTSRHRSGTIIPMKETHEKQEDGGMSCVGSCSINTNSSSHQCPEKYAEHRCDGDVSDAESCTGPSHEPGNNTGILILRKGWKAAAHHAHDRLVTETVNTQLYAVNKDIPPLL